MILGRDVRTSNCRDELNNTKWGIEENGLERIEAKRLDEKRAERTDATRGYSIGQNVSKWSGAEDGVRTKY